MLAMDTSGDVCSVAALRRGEIRSEHLFRHEMHLSETLMTHLDQVLHEAGCVLADVEAYAVGIGPGSFTGTRIGVMTIKTLAVVQRTPVFAIDSLAAMAAVYEGAGELIVPMLPCRANTVFAAAYDVADSSPRAIAAPAAIPVQELAGTLANDPEPGVLFCGQAIERYCDELSAVLSGKRRIGFGRVYYPSASLIGTLAWRRQLAGDVGDEALAVVPLYISPPPITLPKPRR